MKRILAVLTVSAALSTATYGQVDTFPYFEGFEESDGGFLVGGTNPSWEWGEPEGDFVTRPGEGRRCWATGLARPHNNHETSYLYSPLFDFRSLTSDPWLQFLNIYALGSGDWNWVEISVDGGAFDRLGDPPDPGALHWYNEPEWGHWTGFSGGVGEWFVARHRLSGTAGHLVQVRWVLTTDPSTQRDGVGIDAVSIHESARDIGLRALESPRSGAALTATERVQVVLTNYGTSAETAIPLTIEVLGPVSSRFTEIVPGPIAPQETWTHTLQGTADLSVAGTYSVRVASSLAGDEVPSNDATSRSVRHQRTVDVFPYAESFEQGDGSFLTGGFRSSWELGAPVAHFIHDAGAGGRAWVTNLAGRPSPSEDSHLQSPLFDCRSLRVDVVLQFLHNFDLGGRSWVEVSLDGGPWSKLGRSGDPGALNWYEDPNGHSWAGDTQRSWRRAQHTVPGSAGRTVQVRWILRGDPSPSHEGQGVDLVQVFEAPFGAGQVPQPGLAVLDVNDAREVRGLDVSSGAPGPYYSLISVGTESMRLLVEGTPDHAVCLVGGSLQVGTLHYPGSGQVDLSSFEILGCGFFTGGWNSFFWTGATGQMRIHFSLPGTLVGADLALQALVVDVTTGNFHISNVVQINFLP